MKRRIAHLAVAFAALALPSSASAADPTWSRVQSYGFETDAVGSAPTGFTFAKSVSGKPGRWVVGAMPDAPAGRKVLVQSDADRFQDRFLMGLADQPAVRDVRVSVRCKPMQGDVDQACGLVFRYRDTENYYLARSNALESNVRLYHVRSGRRTQLASWAGRVPSGVWHKLAAEIVGDRIRVRFNDEEVIAASDRTFPDGGAVGVWVKADSVSAFDELTIDVPSSNR